MPIASRYPGPVTCLIKSIFYSVNINVLVNGTCSFTFTATCFGCFGKAKLCKRREFKAAFMSYPTTALQRRRIEEAEMKLLRPLAGYTLYGHKINDYIRREPQITGILDKIDEYRRNWPLHLQRMPQNRIPLKSYRYRPQGRRTIGRPKKRWREQL